MFELTAENQCHATNSRGRETDKVVAIPFDRYNCLYNSPAHATRWEKR